LDIEYAIKGKEIIIENEEEEKSNLETWKSLLIVIPLRLGLDRFNHIYVSTIQEIFKFPQSMGILGGKPRSSFYFVGCQDDDVFYLDPHLLQPTISPKEQGISPTYHCPVPKRMKIVDIDPSLALAFYCKTEDDFVSFCDRSRDLSKLTGQTIYNIEKKTPDYLRKRKDVVHTEKFFSDDEDEVVFL